ncbi:MAG: hypothetical protein ACI8RD_011510, partial [Bacillariaceae sp.]
LEHHSKLANIDDGKSIVMESNDLISLFLLDIWG